MKLKIIISILLLLILFVPAMAWVRGLACNGTNLLLGTGCSDVLLTGGSVQLTAN
jgi:hypothetical protein